MATTFNGNAVLQTSVNSCLHQPRLWESIVISIANTYIRKRLSMSKYILWSMQYYQNTRMSHCKILQHASLHVFLAIKTHNPWHSYIMVFCTSTNKLELPKAHRQMTARFTLQTARDIRRRRSKFKAHYYDKAACPNCVITGLTSTCIVTTAVAHVGWKRQSIWVEMLPQSQTLFPYMFKKCLFFL